MNNTDTQTKTFSPNTLEQKAMKLRYTMLYFSNLKNVKSNLEMFIMDEV